MKENVIKEYVIKRISERYQDQIVVNNLLKELQNLSIDSEPLNALSKADQIYQTRVFDVIIDVLIFSFNIKFILEKEGIPLKNDEYRVTHALRSPLGSVKNSYHCLGLAVDLRGPFIDFLLTDRKAANLFKLYCATQIKEDNLTQVLVEFYLLSNVKAFLTDTQKLHPCYTLLHITGCLNGDNRKYKKSGLKNFAVGLDFMHHERSVALSSLKEIKLT